MKKLVLGVVIILSLLAVQEVNAYYGYAPYSYGYYPYSYRYDGYYRWGYYQWGYANPYLIDRPLSTIERDPMTRFALANTDRLYSFVSANRNYYYLR